MRINSIPNKFEIFQEYYLMTKGKQISYNEALNLYFALDDTEKNEFAKYYRDETGYEIIDENGYDLGENVRYDEKTKTSNLNLISKHNLKIKYTLDAYAKKQGLTLDPQWAGYSAEEIINMENSGVNIPKEVLDIAHSIYESTGANYIAGSDEDNGTTEKEPFLELMPKAAKKIEKCNEYNDKLNDAIEKLIPEEREMQSKVEDRLKEQKESLKEYENLVKEWNKIQTKINNGEALSDKEAQRYAELTGMFEDKKTNSDETDFNIDRREIAKSLNEINIIATLGENLANETLEIGDTLSDYIAQNNYKTTQQATAKEVGFIGAILAMARGKRLAEETSKIGNNTKEYTSDSKQSVNNIASTLDIKDQIATPSVEINEQESNSENGVTASNNPENPSSEKEAKNPEISENEDITINDETVKEFIDSATDVNIDLVKQTINAVKTDKVSKENNKYATKAKAKVDKLANEYQKEEEIQKEQINTLETQNKKLKDEITNITGQSETEIDKDLANENPDQYNGMEESDKKIIQNNKETLIKNNEEIETIQTENEGAIDNFRQSTAPEKAAVNKSIPTENENLKTNSEYKEEIIPAAKEQLNLTKNSGITLSRIGKYRFKVGAQQLATFQISKGLKNIAKGTTSMAIGGSAVVAGNNIISTISEKATDKAISSGTNAVENLTNIDAQISSITGENTAGTTIENNGEENTQVQAAEDKEDTTGTNTQTNNTVNEIVTPVSNNNAEVSNTPVSNSPKNAIKNIEDIATARENNNAAKAVETKATNSGNDEDANSVDINKNNAKSEASKANNSLKGIKSETEKDNKETTSIIKDEKKSEKELEKEAKNLEKQIKKESEKMERLQKETERIQKRQEQILVEYEQLSIQNEQFMAEAQAAALNQPAQKQDQGGILGTNSFDVSQSQNPVVNEKVSSIEYNNQRIGEIGREFKVNDKNVQRNQTQIITSQKFIKTTHKKFQKVTKLKENKANERLKAEQQKQEKLEKKINIVGIFEKVFQLVTAVGTLLLLVPFTTALGAVLQKIGVAGTLFCAMVKSGIYAANGNIQQAFLTLGISIATAAVSMTGAGAAAGKGLQIATAALNTTSSAAALGASVQEFKGKDSGILSSIATVAGAASAVTGAVGAFGSLGSAGNTLAKVSTIAMQSGSLISTSGNMINQVREWSGKEDDSKVANILGMVGMGLTLVGTAGTLTSRAIGTKGNKNEKVDGTENNKDADNNKNSENTEKNEQTENKETAQEQMVPFEDPNAKDITIAYDDANAEPIVESKVNTSTDVQEQQIAELEQAAMQSPDQANDDAVESINEEVNNKKMIPFEDPEAEDITIVKDSPADKIVEPSLKQEAHEKTLAFAKENIQMASSATANNDKKDLFETVMKSVESGINIASTLMTNNDDSDDDTKDKAATPGKLTERTKEIMRKRKKRLESLNRYFA